MRIKVSGWAALPFLTLTLISCGGVSSLASSGSSGSTSKSGVSTSSDPASATSKQTTSLPAIDYVKVFCATSWNYTYAWTEEGGTVTKLVGDWPGAALNDFDSNWKTYDFTGYTAFNIIFNTGNGGNQTGDLSIPRAGYWYFYNDQWYNEDPTEGGTSSTSQSALSASSAITATDYLNFPLWDELTPSDKTIVSPYRGARTDFRDESIYFAITTRFYNGDSSNDAYCWDGKLNRAANDPEWRGDFKGLIAKMDYIKALGFTSIWLTPVVENASGLDYHGYHAYDFSKVDPRYLSEDVSFQSVIDAAHSRDMKIILDVVFNHTGNFGEANLYPMFNRSETDRTVQGLVPAGNGLLPSNYSSLSDQYGARINSMKSDTVDVNKIYHHEKNMSYESYLEQVGQIAGDCVDLNTENPTVANYLVKCYGQFIHMGVDAFRIDTMKHISRLTFNRYLWPALYHYADLCGNSHFFMYGEVCTRVREIWNHNIAADSCPFYTWKETKDYPWGDRDTNYASAIKLFQDNTSSDGQPTSNNVFLNGVSYRPTDYSRWSGVSTIDFPMHWNFYHARDAFNVALGGDKYYNDASYNVVYVDSHDYSPDDCQDFRYTGSQSDWAENMDLMFTFRGVPCVYYGSEIEFQKGKKIDGGTNLALKDSGRAYYGDYLEGDVSASDFGTYTASGTVASTLASPLSQHLIKLNQIRLKVPALRRGQYTTSNVSGSGMAFTRRYTAGIIDSLACVAISGSATFTGLPSGTYVDLVSGDRRSVSGSLSITSLGTSNLRVYVLENASTGTLSKVGGSLTYLK